MHGHARPCIFVFVGFRVQFVYSHFKLLPDGVFTAWNVDGSKLTGADFVERLQSVPGRRRPDNQLWLPFETEQTSATGS